MITEQFISILIFTHAFFGGVALLSGMIALIAKKGKKAHRKAGLCFTIPCCFPHLLHLLFL